MAFESNLNGMEAIIAEGVKGAKSKSFSKKFKNLDAFQRWIDTDAAGDYEVHYVRNAY